MFTKKSMYLLPVLVLLFLSLVTTASTAGTRAEAQGGAKIEHLTVYIHALQPAADGKLTLTADPIEWYEGADADRVFAEREPEAAAEIGGALDDYYIVNDSNQLTTYQVADNAAVTMQIYDHTGKIEDLDINWNESISLQKFAAEFAKTGVFDLSQSPYHLTIENGEITSIVQQYTP
ncbi:hypothetical protein PAECIP111892_02814 [Paenibacillus auburnensis]|uniref:Uncharacterized protein n=1 Tax=Paenibacillus auburnensis TaxID=2905649 RepID=A0ABN8GCZ6_9BACL|nr:hypothetical protein [Paenibacillus auburnensis]CAH1205940.1 hypothetical protein PAECIP111892_02814 [Paenibacillus auburnensis]